MTSTTALDDLAETVQGEAREAAEADAIDGVQPRWVASPSSLDQASALLRTAARLGLTVVPRGRGTTIDWGAPPRTVDLVVSTERLNRVVEHVAGDLVCVVQAGATLDAVNAEVSPHGQQLALDQPVPGATVGGTVSTTRSGPRRLLYGTPRDQVLGITIVRADGTVATAGGKVVKNVAGYDLAKLLGGAYGTLGLICQTVLRLYPVPRAQRWLHASYPEVDAAAAAAGQVGGSQITPSALEIRRAAGSQGADVYVLLEGTEGGLDRRAKETVDLLGVSARTVEPDAPDGDRLTELPGAGDGTLVKVAVPIPGVASVLRVAQEAETQHGVSCRVQGSAGTGVLYLAVGGGADAVAHTVTALREAAVGGSAVVLRTSPAVRELVDAWGPVSGLPLMRRVKDEFDPEHRLAPGRFVGGI
ncbi:MAG: FAD-binding oxidoreductase [Nocardioidaceae bacterium]